MAVKARLKQHPRLFYFGELRNLFEASTAQTKRKHSNTKAHPKHHSRRHKAVLLAASLAVSACGGGGSDSRPSNGSDDDAMGDSTDLNAPQLSFEPATLQVTSGESMSAVLNASDNIGITSGPSVSCSNGGRYNLSTGVFTAPEVMTQTTSICTATALDAAGNQGLAELSVSIRASTLASACPRTLPAVSANTCDVSAGSGSATLLQGTVLLNTGLTTAAEILIEEGQITCASCDCSGETSFTAATVLNCGEAVISPGLINGRESITFSYNPPFNNDERYLHRHDWRIGNRGTKLESPFRGSGSQVIWGEIRSVMGGVTSSVSSGGELGMLRNLDRDNFTPALLEENIPAEGYVVELGANGIDRDGTHVETFPLGDADGTLVSASCDYDDFPDEGDFRRNPILASELNLDFFGQMMQLLIPPDTLLPARPLVLTVAEGLDEFARNEFLCLAGLAQNSRDFLGENTVMVSGSGLSAEDMTLAADKGAGLMWTPRADTSLYGNTAMIPVFTQAGGVLGLATGFEPAGSAHIGRELACAAEWNERWGGHILDAQSLVRLATGNNALLTGYGDLLGELAPGKLADITVWRTENHSGLDAIIHAESADVALVLRDGIALYGDDNIIEELAPQDNCELIEVCGQARRICAEREFNTHYADIIATAPAGAYELFACNAEWPDEPSCLPHRTTPDTYTGLASNADTDGDGVDDSIDNCVGVFNPPTPLEPGVQADTDGDGMGDLCDF